MIARGSPQSWRLRTGVGFLRRNLRLLGVSSGAKSWTGRSPSQDCHPTIFWAPHSCPQPPLGRRHPCLPTYRLERPRGPAGELPPNREQTTRRTERGGLIPRVLNRPPPRQLSLHGLLSLQLQISLSLLAPSRWRGSVRREQLCAPCSPPVGVVTTLVVCVCWRSRESYPGRPRGVALLASLPMQRAVPGRSSPTPTRRGTTRRCGVSGWPFGST
jgi:hypothetical protein